MKSCKEQFRQAEFDLGLLETELAEAEKPQLIEGDYGGVPGPWVMTSKGIMWVNGSGDGFSGLDPEDFTDEKMGNFLDDLKAMQEPLTEFDRTDLKLKSSAANCFGFKINGITIDYHGDKYVSLSLDEIREAILNLRRLVATAERKKNG